MSPVDRVNPQGNPTIRLNLNDAGLEDKVSSIINRQMQEFQDGCKEHYTEHYRQRVVDYFHAGTSQIENSVLKFGVSPFVAVWAALKTFYDAAGVQRALIESYYDSAPFHLLYVNTSASSPAENCPLTIPLPAAALAVTKGGRSDHADIISEVKWRLAENFRDDLGEGSIDELLINGDQIFTAYFDVLTTQLKRRLWPEQYPLYQAAFARYIEPLIKGGSDAMYVGELFQASYEWVLNFKEEIDIPEGDEPAGEEEFESITKTAQGPFASTCGVYAIFSLFESMGKLQEIKEQYGIHTYAELDRATFEFMKDNATYSEIMIPNIQLFRNQGMPVGSLLTLARDIADTLGMDGSVTFRQIEMRGNLSEVFFGGYPNGFIATISSDVGPHAVHVLGYNRRTRMVSYYDPIGADGRSNVKQLPLAEFNKLRLKTGEFAKITVVEPA